MCFTIANASRVFFPNLLSSAYHNKSFKILYLKNSNINSEQMKTYFKFLFPENCLQAKISMLTTNM